MIFKKLTAAEVQRFSKKLGRPLTPAEILTGHMRRPGWSPVPFRPILPQGPEPYEREYQDAKRAVESERLRSLTPSQRMLDTIEKARAKRKADELAKADHQTKLKLFAPQLQQLDRLLDEARFDDSYSDQELAALWHAKAQIEAEGACPVVAEEMFAACIATAHVKTEGRRAATAAEIARKQEDLANLQSQLGELDVMDASLTGNKSKFDRKHPAVKGYLDDDFSQLSTAEMKSRETAYESYCAACDPSSVPEHSAPTMGGQPNV